MQHHGKGSGEGCRTQMEVTKVNTSFKHRMVRMGRVKKTISMERLGSGGAWMPRILGGQMVRAGTGKRAPMVLGEMIGGDRMNDGPRIEGMNQAGDRKMETISWSLR